MTISRKSGIATDRLRNLKYVFPGHNVTIYAFPIMRSANRGILEFITRCATKGDCMHRFVFISGRPIEYSVRGNENLKVEKL